MNIADFACRSDFEFGFSLWCEIFAYHMKIIAIVVIGHCSWDILDINCWIKDDNDRQIKLIMKLFLLVFDSRIWLD